MKPIPKRTTVIQSGMAQFETAKFTIDVNAKSFRILIDKLYTDKITAVIRELSTNALDAQTQAGRADVPFDVHIPTTSELFFSVRDYGTSLAHADVMGLYATLFQSTSENSNSVVGQLGLGSKSPFSYTDSFTVEAYLDGSKRTYFASLGSDGIPTISLISEVEIDEADGLKVSVPVQLKDCAEFGQKARRVYFGFDVKPNGVDVSDFMTELMSGPSWRVYPRVMPSVGYSSTNSRGYSDSFEQHLYIRQGSVIYPVAMGDINAHLYKAGLTPTVTLDEPSWFDDITTVGKKRNEYKKVPLSDIRRSNSIELSVPKSSVIIDVPIGSVEIAPSREALSMDDFTKEFVAAAYSETMGEITEQIHTRIARITNHYDMSEFVNSLNDFLQVKKAHFSWLGVETRDALKQISRLTEKPLKNFYLEDIPSVQKNYASYGCMTNVHIDVLSGPKRPRILIVDSLSKIPRHKMRIKRYLANGVGYRTIVMVDPSNKDLEKITRRLRLTNADFIRDYNLRDYPPKKKIKPEKDAEEKEKEKTTRGVYLLSGYGRLENPSSIESGHAWIELPYGAKNTSRVGPSGEFASNAVINFFNNTFSAYNVHQQYVGSGYIPLYGVGPSRIKDFDDDKHLLNILPTAYHGLDWANIRLSHAFYDRFGSLFFEDHMLATIYESIFGKPMKIMQYNMRNAFRRANVEYYLRGSASYLESEKFFTMLCSDETISDPDDSDREMISTLEDDYPLLFAPQSATIEQIKTYMSAVKKKKS